MLKLLFIDISNSQLTDLFHWFALYPIYFLAIYATENIIKSMQSICQDEQNYSLFFW
jgi:hypothetical protein